MKTLGAMKGNRNVSRKASLLIFFGMLLCGVVCIGPASIFQQPQILMFAWMFPIGFLGLFSPDQSAMHPLLLEKLLAILGGVLAIGAYPLMCVVFFKLRTRKALTIACLVLALLLVLNVAGCRTMIQHMPRVE
jgi:hypothetical protein